MKNLKIVVIVFFALAVSATSYAQGSFSVHVGPSFPLGDFGSDDVDDDEDAAGAAIGLNVGVQYLYPISKTGLSVFGGIDFNYNGLKKDVKEDIEDLYTLNGYLDADVKHYKFINIPVTAGLTYAYQINEKFDVFGNGGLAFNFLKVTNFEVEVLGEKATRETDLATHLGFKIGAGVLVDKKYSVSLDYLGLGEHDLKGKTNAGGYSQDFEDKLKVNLLNLTVGMRF